MRTDRIDLYLLHWESRYPLEETLAAFRLLAEQGKILSYGVSNFDVDEMERLTRSANGDGVTANQVLYNLSRRGAERRLIPWCRERGIQVMAYSPLEQGRLPRKGALTRVARRRGATPEQVALAWALRLGGVITIPKAATARHVRENAAAADLLLTEQDLADLDRAFPAPERDVPLECL